ncbi:uncharacterized protein LOC144902623 [Branchiostoma floridae x Branchiostoma belcheri]
MRLAQFFVLCAIISIGAGDKELELAAKLDEYAHSDDREVFFHVAIEIPARKIECFYQHVGEDAKMEVSFELLKDTGTDEKVVVKMWDPSGTEIVRRVVTSDGSSIEPDGNIPGTYKICFYNLNKLFARLVDVSLTVSNVDWRENIEALPEALLEDLDKTHVTESLGKLRTLFTLVRLQVEVVKRRMFSDFLTVQSNLTYVDRLGLMSCVAIIGSGMLQVFFVRRMFETPNVRGTKNKT